MTTDQPPGQAFGGEGQSPRDATDGARTGGGQVPAAALLRAEVQAAREQLGDTVEALARAYVRARVNERIKRTFARSDSTPHPERMHDDRPVSELTNLASEQATKLVRSEVRLAQLELQERTKHARSGLVLVGAGGVVAVLAAGASVAALILLVAASGRRPWVAAACVAAALLTAAVAMGLSGRRLVQQAREERRNARASSPVKSSRDAGLDVAGLGSP